MKFKTFADLMRALPREAREKTAARGGFTKRRHEDGDIVYACQDGLCVMAALITDLTGTTPQKPFDEGPNTHPGGYTIAETIARHLNLVTTPKNENMDEQEWWRVYDLIDPIRVAIKANDRGELAGPAAVRALLVPEEQS